MIDMSGLQAIVADGGVIGRNPSAIGGTWAWAFVDTTLDERLIAGSGVLPAALGPGGLMTNNVTELTAIVFAMRALKVRWGAEGCKAWRGEIISDSEVTLGRLFLGWALTNVPVWLQEALTEVRHDWNFHATTLSRHILTGEPLQGVERLRIRPRLVKGHPTPAMLQKGIGNIHQVWCDRTCQDIAKRYGPGDTIGDGIFDQASKIREVGQ